MKNLKKISKSSKNRVGGRRPPTRLGWLLFGIIILFSFIYLSPLAEAVSAEKGNFIILGNAMNKDEQGKVVYEDEFVALWAQPGASNIKLGKAESGTQARVLDKTKVGPGNFYFIKTVGEEAGLMGWVNEDYIYQITDAPQGE